METYGLGTRWVAEIRESGRWASSQGLVPLARPEVTEGQAGNAAEVPAMRLSALPIPREGPLDLGRGGRASRTTASAGTVVIVLRRDVPIQRGIPRTMTRRSTICDARA
jgi:hypothetical protein